MHSAVSVILTAYNAENYIAETIQSILIQSHTEFTFIIIDDGSTDNTAAIIRSFRDTRISPYYLDHRGRSASLNFAVKQCSGDYVAFIDADDIAVPHRLEKQLDCMRQHPEYDIISSSYLVTDADGRITKTVRLPAKHADIERMMTVHCSMRFPGSMMKRSVLDSVGPFNTENTAGSEDFEFFIKALPLFTFHNIHEPLLLYRRHQRSLSYVRRERQERSVVELSAAYLNGLMAAEGSNTGDIYFRLGLSEYYHGSMARAREYFMLCRKTGDTPSDFYRYFIPSHIPPGLFSLFRRIYNLYNLNY